MHKGSESFCLKVHVELDRKTGKIYKIYVSAMFWHIVYLALQGRTKNGFKFNSVRYEDNRRV